MYTLLEKIAQGILQTPFWEWVGVITSIAYVILAAMRNILCWSFALISSACYIYLCFSANLYIDTLLQAFYFATGVLGWIFWHRSAREEESKVTTWGFKDNLFNILASGVLTVSLGYIFDRFTLQASPYTDAFVTCFSLSATLMITKKVHEGWIYLIIVDFVSIFLYAGRDLYMTSLLYVMYTVIAVFGWWGWYASFKTSRRSTQDDFFAR